MFESSFALYPAIAVIPAFAISSSSYVSSLALFLCAFGPNVLSNGSIVSIFTYSGSKSLINAVGSLAERNKN